MRPIEEELLRRVRGGELKLSINGDVDIVYYHRRHRCWKTKQPDAHPENGRARYRFGKDRSTVYRNRLVWLISNLQPIPDDCVVDHRDRNRLNDMPDNLQLMLRKDSHCQGQEIWANNALGRLLRWFDFVFEYDREPQTPREISWVEVGF